MPPKLASHISQERMVEYQEAFSSFDEDGKGKIPAEMVLQCMRKCGLMPSICEIEVSLYILGTHIFLITLFKLSVETFVIVYTIRFKLMTVLNKFILKLKLNYNL